MSSLASGKCIICDRTAVPTTRYCGGDRGCQKTELSEKERLTNLFAMATDQKQVLGYLAGFASMCWEPRPSTGEFDSSAAELAVDIASDRLQELSNESLGDISHTMLPDGRKVLRGSKEHADWLNHA